MSKNEHRKDLLSNGDSDDLSAVGANTPTHNPAPPTKEASRAKQGHGSGHLHLASSSNRAQFATLSASYPLKLLSPTPLPSQPPNVAAVYTLAYGGGLVAGDIITLRVDVDAGCGLVILTQGSTKVYKHRPGLRPLSHSLIRSSAPDTEDTKQRLLITLAPGAWVMVLPDSISPYRDSRFAQAQRFVLPGDGTASVLVLDWVNSGRGSPLPKLAGDKGGDEVWAMDRYGSTNEILLGERLLMRERLLLDRSSTDAKGLRKRMEPYHIYATLLIVGPHFAPLIRSLEQMADRTSQFQLSAPPGLVWAFSRTSPEGGVLRVAATETEDARKWLRTALEDGGVQDLVGDGLWTRIMR